MFFVLEMHYLSNVDTPSSDNLDRSKFRDHYTNEVKKDLNFKFNFFIYLNCAFLNLVCLGREKSYYRCWC